MTNVNFPKFLPKIKTNLILFFQKNYVFFSLLKLIDYTEPEFDVLKGFWPLLTGIGSFSLVPSPTLLDVYLWFPSD